MNILLACYHTKALHDALTANGHKVTSCDLKPALHSGCHIIGDVREVLAGPWDMLIGFPPCTYLARVQQWRVLRSAERKRLQDKAVRFAMDLYAADIPQVAIENPVGWLSQAWRQPNQIVRPWWFGDPYRKEICLWTKNVPGLLATLYNPVRKSVANHVNGRMSQERKSEIKSSWDHYPGMCAAIAAQWAPPFGLSYGPLLDHG